MHIHAHGLMLRSRGAAGMLSEELDLLLIEEVEGFALVAGQLLQGAALLLHRRLDLRGGRVVLDVHRGLPRRLLGPSARRAKQTAETGGVRAGQWKGKEGGRGETKHTDKTYRRADKSSSSSRGRAQHSGVKRLVSERQHTPCRLPHTHQ